MHFVSFSSFHPQEKTSYSALLEKRKIIWKRKKKKEHWFKKTHAPQCWQQHSRGNLSVPQQNTPMCSVVSDSLRPTWTVAHQASLSMEFFQARTLEWIANSYSRGSSQPRDEPVSPASPALQANSLLLSHQQSPINKKSYSMNKYEYIHMQWNTIQPLKNKILLFTATWTWRVLY